MHVLSRNASTVEITAGGKIRKYLLFHNKNKFFIQHSSVLKNFCSKVIYNLTNKQQFMLRALISWGFLLASVSLVVDRSQHFKNLNFQSCLYRRITFKGWNMRTGCTKMARNRSWRRIGFKEEYKELLLSREMFLSKSCIAGFEWSRLGERSG